MFRLVDSIVLLCTIVFASNCHADANVEFHDLVRTGGFTEVKTALAKDGRLVAAKDKMERTPLHVAAQCGRANIVDLLVKSGADVNAKAFSGFTPLHFA